MVIIWISVLLIIKAVNSCVYECSARKLFHSSGHGSPNMTEFWMWQCGYIHSTQRSGACICVRNNGTLVIANQALVLEVIYCRSADCGFFLCERVKRKNETPSKLNLTLFKGIWNFLIFFFLTLWCFFSHICECKKTCIEPTGNNSRFLCDFFPLSLSLSQKRGECEKVFGFF